MKIVLFGSSGMIGQRIVAEALTRGHQITAVVRNPAKHSNVDANSNLIYVQGNIIDPVSVAQVVAGHDAVISAVGPARDGSDQPAMILHTAHALIQGLSKAGVKRLLIVGGAGSLEVAPGLHLLDTPEFPAVVKPFAAAHRDALEVYRKEAPADLEWTYLSPAGVIAPGERTGQFRLGTDQLLTDEQGRSHISVEDFAIALLNELEQPQAIRRRITVAY